MWSKSNIHYWVQSFLTAILPIISLNEYLSNHEMQEKKLDNSEMSRILLVEKVGPFNTTWLFYKPRKITIYYDDRTVHVAV